MRASTIDHTVATARLYSTVLILLYNILRRLLAMIEGIFAVWVGHFYRWAIIQYPVAQTALALAGNVMPRTSRLPRGYCRATAAAVEPELISVQ
jgi:hypothetical protein